MFVGTIKTVAIVGVISMPCKQRSKTCLGTECAWGNMPRTARRGSVRRACLATECAWEDDTPRIARGDPCPGAYRTLPLHRFTVQHKILKRCVHRPGVTGEGSEGGFSRVSAPQIHASAPDQ
eukprot:scaffold41577_cov19-Tisochrysis_lutea.AAC.5